MLPTEVFSLFNLRYLGLRSTAIESLPESIGRLQNLEVLDALNAPLSCLPNNIVKLKMLRYLYAYCYYQVGPEIKPSGGVKVPSGIRHLTSLQALQCVEASSEILCEVGYLTELRTFGVCNVRSDKHSGDLRNAINKMSHLVHLDIILAVEEGEVLQLEGLQLPPTLSVLNLEGQLEKTSMPRVFSSWSHLCSLRRLHISLSNIDEESFSCLLVLRGLCCLALLNAFVGKKLHFTAGCFPELRCLSICLAPQLNHIQIEEGAMPSLTELWLIACRELKSLPQGIEHLTSLEELNLLDASKELKDKLKLKGAPNEGRDDLMCISHIRKVIV
jgi:disease resistance protein RPM1